LPLQGEAYRHLLIDHKNSLWDESNVRNREQFVKKKQLRAERLVHLFKPPPNNKKVME